MVSFWGTFILVVVILSFIVGFAYLIVKLSPKKGSKEEGGV